MTARQLACDRPTRAPASVESSSHLPAIAFHATRHSRSLSGAGGRPLLVSRGCSNRVRRSDADPGDRSQGVDAGQPSAFQRGRCRSPPEGTPPCRSPSGGDRSPAAPRTRPCSCSGADRLELRIERLDARLRGGVALRRLRRAARVVPGLRIGQLRARSPPARPRPPRSPTRAGARGGPDPSASSRISTFAPHLDEDREREPPALAARQAVERLLRRLAAEQEAAE